MTRSACRTVRGLGSYRTVRPRRENHTQRKKCWPIGTFAIARSIVLLMRSILPIRTVDSFGTRSPKKRASAHQSSAPSPSYGAARGSHTCCDEHGHWVGEKPTLTKISEKPDGHMRKIDEYAFVVVPQVGQVSGRSEERRVGKECRSRWSP